MRSKPGSFTQFCLVATVGPFFHQHRPSLGHGRNALGFRAPWTPIFRRKSSAPEFCHGKVFGAVVSFVDITERRRKQMELRHGQKREAVGRLAAGIAHEINTPVKFVGDNTRFLQNAFTDKLKLVHKYLLSLGGLPNGIVEAVAHHHHPRRVPANGVDMILVVYAANLLANEVIAAEKGVPPPPFDLDYLREAGALDLLPN
jgi:signal transduction histidine kinase